MDGHEQVGNPNISENMSRLLVDDLEIGYYGLFEDDLKIDIEITNTSDSGQHIVVHTENEAKTERISTVIQVQPTQSGEKLPIISAVSTRTRSDSKESQTTYWHSRMPEIDWGGRFKNDDSMSASDLNRIIEYAKSPNKKLIPKDQ
jgi:hypothetical protein